MTREESFALQNAAQCFTGHQLHHEVGTAFLFAVVEDVRDALVVHESGVPGLSPETLSEARIPHVFVFEDLDGDGATNDGVIGFPHLTHTADGDSGDKLVAGSKHLAGGRSHRWITASMMVLATGDATEFDVPSELEPSMTTAIAS